MHETLWNQYSTKMVIIFISNLISAGKSDASFNTIGLLKEKLNLYKAVNHSVILMS